MRRVGLAVCAGLVVIAVIGCGGTNTRTVVTVENHTTTVMQTQTVTSTAAGGGSAANSGAVPSVQTLGQFVQLPRPVRERVAIHVLTTNPDKCQNGKPTPLGVAKNIAPELAQFQPGKDIATGKDIPGSMPIAKALAFAEAQIGC